MPMFAVTFCYTMDSYDEITIELTASNKHEAKEFIYNKYKDGKVISVKQC